jgi:hypothetical protein
MYPFSHGGSDNVLFWCSLLFLSLSLREGDLVTQWLNALWPQCRLDLIWEELGRNAIWFNWEMDMRKFTRGVFWYFLEFSSDWKYLYFWSLTYLMSTVYHNKMQVLKRVLFHFFDQETFLFNFIFSLQMLYYIESRYLWLKIF